LDRSAANPDDSEKTYELKKRRNVYQHDLTQGNLNQTTTVRFKYKTNHMSKEIKGKLYGSEVVNSTYGQLEFHSVVVTD